MQNCIEKFQKRIFIFIFMGLPIASLLIKIISYLRYGVDMPLNDDWWGYAMGKMDSFDFDYIFRANNGTLAVVGYTFDSLAQKYLDGNSVIYQFLSMSIVLGGLLIFQWKLLYKALADKRLAAMCFAATLLMLQPGTYWGSENMAYHQALPLFFMLWTLVLVFSNTAHDGWRLPLIFILGLLASFSYISGSFAVLSLGFVLFVSYFFTKQIKFNRIFFRSGLILILVGFAVSATHYMQAIQPFKSGKNIGYFVMAYPNEAEFWLFFLGKVARSLGLSTNFPVTSLVATIFISLLALGIFCFCCFKLLKRQVNENNFKLLIIYIALFAVVVTYLMMISAARTHIRTMSSLVESPFLFGFERFHFFWATLLWPWVVAGLLLAIKTKTTWLKRQSMVFICNLCIVILIALILGAGAARHKREFQNTAAARESAMQCLRIKLQAGGPIYCKEEGLLPGWLPFQDFAQIYIRAQKMGTSFVHKFPILPIQLGANAPPPLFRLDATTLQKIKIRNARLVAGATKWRWQAQEEAQLIIPIENAAEMAKCSRLDVAIRMRVESAALAQIFYRFAGTENYSAEHTQGRYIPAMPDGFQRFDFQIESPIGFENELRFDPVASAQPFEIAELEVRCRLPVLAYP